MNNAQPWNWVKRNLLSRRRRRSAARKSRRDGGLQYETLENKTLLAVDLALSVDADVSEVSAGGQITYTMVVSDNGDEPAGTPLLRTWIPSNTTFNPALSDASWNCGDGSFNCTLESPTLSASIVFVVDVNFDIPSRISQISSFSFVSDDGSTPDENRSNNFVSQRTSVIRDLHDLAITLDDSDVEASPGDTVNHAISYSNTGASTANGVSITARLPQETTLATTNTDSWNCVGSNCTLDIGDVNSGGSGSATFSVTVNENTIAQRLTTTARIADNGTGAADGDLGNNFAFESTPVIQELPDLSISVDDDDSTVVPGGAFSYTVEYGNDGAIEAENVVISQLVPSFTSFDVGSNANGWVCDAGVCTLSLGNLAAGATGTATFPLIANADIPLHARSLFGSARISSDTGGGRDANRLNNADFDRTPIDRQLPDISISIDDGDATTQPSGSVTYTIDYGNAGSVAAEGVVITQVVPTGTTVDATAAAAAGWDCDTRVCQLDVGDLAPSQTGSSTFVVNVNSDISSRVRNLFASARISDATTAGNDGDRTNNSDFDRTPVSHQLSDLSLTIDGGETPVAPGAIVAFDLNYANLGSALASEVELKVNVPRNTTFDIDASDPGWTCDVDGKQCTLNVADLAVAGQVGDVGTSVFAVTVNADVSSLVRRVFAIGRISDDGSDSDPLNNTSFDGVVIDHS